MEKDGKALFVAPWIRIFSGGKGCVLYDFRAKSTRLFSPMVFSKLLEVLPLSFDSILEILQFAFPLADPQKIRTFLSLLCDDQILVSRDYSNDLVSQGINLGFSDEYSLLPQHVCFEITTRCNFKCKHCYLGNAKNTPIDLPSEDIFKFCRSLRTLGVDKIQITGGEPLIRDDFNDICLRLCDDFQIELTTNGSLINKNNIDVLSKIDTLQISVYGFSSESYQQFTGSQHHDGFRNFLTNLELAKSRCKDLTLAFVITQTNQNELENFADFCQTSGFNYRVGFSMPVGTACENMSLLYLDTKRKKELVHTFGNSRFESKSGLQKHCCNPNKIVVLANGLVLPCAMLRERARDNPHFLLGSVYKDEVSQICGSNRLRFSEYIDIDSTRPCANCEVKYVCGGVCPAISHDSVLGDTIGSCRIYNGKDVLELKLLPQSR